MQIRRKKSNKSFWLLGNNVKDSCKDGSWCCQIMGLYSGWIFGATMLFIFYILLRQDSNVREHELDMVASSLKIPKPAVTTTLEQHQQHEQSEQQHPFLSIQNDLTCQDAKEFVRKGTWPDPNEGKIWARETITAPHFRISLHAQDYDPVRWKIMEEGKYYEDEVHERFVQILQNHDKQQPSIVVDVGANIGYYTLLSASLGYSVVAFEPNPTNVLRLCDSLRLNDFDSRPGTGSPPPFVHIFQNAVSNVHGEEMMLHSPRNPGQAFLRPMEKENSDNQTPDSHKAKTTVIMLDKWAQQQHWFDDVDFKIKILKVDVEGKEPQVFLGAKQLLQSHKIQHILTEGRRFGRPNIQESFAVLFETGYTVKEPPELVPLLLKASHLSPKEKAKLVCEWYLQTLGSNSQKVRDMWWVLKE